MIVLICCKVCGPRLLQATPMCLPLLCVKKWYNHCTWNLRANGSILRGVCLVYQVVTNKEKKTERLRFLDRKISRMNHTGSGIVTLRKCVIWRFPFLTVCTQVKHPTTALLLHDGEICVRFFKPNVETKCAFPGWHAKAERYQHFCHVI